jgi:hypothetical protein
VHKGEPTRTAIRLLHKNPAGRMAAAGLWCDRAKHAPVVNRTEADMTTLTSTKLTNTQLIALSGAVQRQDGTVSLPERIKGTAAQKLATRHYVLCRVQW